MKKLFYLPLIAFLTFGMLNLTSCGDDNEKENNPEQEEKRKEQPQPQAGNITIEQLTSATWETDFYGDSTSVSFTNNKLTIMRNGQVKKEYAYTLKDGVITIDEGQMQIVSVPCPLYGNDVIVFKEIITRSETQEGLAFILIKAGAKINVTAQDIKGFWCWYDVFTEDTGEIIRAAIKLDGQNFELTITPWGQRYIGTYTYENAILTLNTTQGLTSRQPGTGDGVLWDRLDPYTLECEEWAELNPSYWDVDAVSGNIFVVNSTNAFGTIANISSILEPKR